jgi:hypothetical protein
MPSTDLERLAAEVRRLVDIEAIKQLKAKYVRLADAKQWDAWGREVLTEDCLLETDSAPQQGRDAAVSHFKKALADALSVHRIHTPEITLTGEDTASAIWPVSDYVRGNLGGRNILLRGYGYYYEDYVRTAEGWRLKHGRMVRQRVDIEPLEDAA